MLYVYFETTRPWRSTTSNTPVEGFARRWLDTFWNPPRACSYICSLKLAVIPVIGHAVCIQLYTMSRLCVRCACHVWGPMLVGRVGESLRYVTPMPVLGADGSGARRASTAGYTGPGVRHGDESVWRA